MINFPTAEFVSIVAELTQYDAIRDGDPEPFINDGLCRVAVKTSSSVGFGDEVRRTDDAATHTQKIEWGGHRRCVVSVTIEIHDQSVSACDVAERLRLRLQRENIKALLLGVDCSITGFEAVNSPSLVRDNRDVDYATLDIHVLRLVSEVDETADGGIIETVNTTDEPEADVTT